MSRVNPTGKYAWGNTAGKSGGKVMKACWNSGPLPRFDPVFQRRSRKRPCDPTAPSRPTTRRSARRRWGRPWGFGHGETGPLQPKKFRRADPGLYRRGLRLRRLVRQKPLPDLAGRPGRLAGKTGEVTGENDRGGRRF